MNSARTNPTLLLVALFALPARIPAQTPQSGTQKITYEVAAIRAHQPDGSNNWKWGTTTDGFSATNIPLRRLIFAAYDLTLGAQLTGLPKWAGSARYDIQAKMDEQSITALHKLSREQSTEQRRLMLQALLADRFALRVHSETRELPVYDLVIAKSGFKLKPSTSKKGGWFEGNGKFSGTAITLANLARGLTLELKRIVRDKTALAGHYDIKLNWTPFDAKPSANSGPSLFTALQEQLGLKLVPAKAPVDVVVVDHIDHPTPN